jgi:orotidine-5'-phosphate decarboxylase|tara:strand:+ start:2492 stop:3190 length:699 start_codon:yes stop_codon:yes gene_type:complete
MMKYIFIACDTSSVVKIKSIIANTNINTSKLKIGYKIGLEFFYSKKGRAFISKVQNNKYIFLDLKLNDIPNTCVSSIKSLKDLKNIKYLTVHINGGYEMLSAIKKNAKKINKNLKILGVTILTSLTKKSLEEIGHTKSIKNLVVKQARLAKRAGLDGIVCSGHEIKTIKKICSNMEIITPGIRMLGDKAQDQKRVMTPQQAFNNGATSIVVGRSITKGNIKKKIKNLIKSLA